jgi:uncharacterized membrane protein
MRWLPKLWLELSLPQKWLLSAGLGLVALFLVVVPPFQKPDEQIHFFRAVGVARGNLVCSKNQQKVFQNYIPAYLAKLPDDAYVSHLAFNDEVKFSWKVFLTNAHHPSAQSGVASSMVNTPKACSLPFLMYLPIAAVLMVPVWLQADPVLIFFLGRLTQTAVAVGLWLAAVWLTPKKLRLLPLFLLIIPMVPHQLTSYSKDALHLSAGVVAVATWLRLVEERASKVKHHLWLLFSLVAAIGVVVLSRPQYGFWLLLPFAVLPAPIHGQLAKKIKQLWPWVVVAVIGLVGTLGAIGFSLRSEMYSSKAQTVGVIAESTTGIYPEVQLQYLITYPAKIATIANETIEQYGIFYLVSMIGQLGWLDNTMYWFVIGGIVGGLVAIGVKVRPTMPILKWWQQTILGAVIVGTLAGIFSSMYLYGTPVASPVVEAVQGRYFLLLLPLIVILAAQFRWQRQAWLVLAVLVGLLLSVVVATLIRYYAFEDYYYVHSVPQTVLKTLAQDGVHQARLELEVGKKIRGVVVAQASSTASAELRTPVVAPYLLLLKDGNCRQVRREVVIDHRRWLAPTGQVEVLFPAQLVLDSQVCIELVPYGVKPSSQQQLELLTQPTTEVIYVH